MEIISKFKIILFLSIIFFSMTPPMFSHGSNENCSPKCNDYLCSLSMQKNKELQRSEEK